ncbi:vigilin [Nephila pilipes]|uniref:Vigilin n=1 Tax=Nephila pilipes TaxID=299642 RepID=A0A8X6NSW0_NEPPI|nr:vigilin [Nephila pilipes]
MSILWDHVDKLFNFFFLETGVSVAMPSPDVQSDTITLRGEQAQQRLHEIVEDLEAIVIVECILQQEHLSIVLGTRGSKVQNIQRQFNVTIKLPDGEKTEDTNKVTKIGDAHADGLEEEFQANFEIQRDELRKEAKQQIFKVQHESRYV